MAKPIIAKTTPFAANQAHTFSFTYSGNQPHSNKITIYNATTLAQVYTNTTTTMQLKSTIPANTLTNGIRYAATIQCYDINGTASTVSDYLYFWCLSTPTFVFSNVTTGQTVYAASLTAQLSYSQSESEEISSFKFYIYDSTRILLSETSDIYDITQNSYTYKGLDTNKNYYIRATGITEKGILLDTGYISIYVSYQSPTTYAMIYADGNDSGVVNYRTNLVVIEPTRNDYDIEDGFIDLTNDTLTYNQGFSIANDFALSVKMENPINNMNTGVVLSNGTTSITLSCVYTGEIVEDTDTDLSVRTFRYKLSVVEGISKYTLYSDTLGVYLDSNYTPQTYDYYTVWIKRVGNLYDLYAYGSNEGGVSV